MNIELITTKKKLTKSIVNQMQTPSAEIMLKCEVLGYVINVVKNSYKTIIIKEGEKYFKISFNYRKWKDNSAVSYKIGRCNIIIKFNTTTKCLYWWSAYEKIKTLAINQIYI